MYRRSYIVEAHLGHACICVFASHYFTVKVGHLILDIDETKVTCLLHVMLLQSLV